MDLTLSCLGLTAAINVHRDHDGSHLVRLPDASSAMTKLTLATHCSTLESAAILATSFEDPGFWKNEAGYEFARKHLPKLLEGGNSHFLDVGSSVGQLVTFLKTAGFWGRLKYTGVDVDSEAIQVACQKHSDAKFKVFNAQSNLVDSFGDFDIVFSKGTLCSTYKPYDALESILGSSSQSALLVHTACTDNDCGPEGYITTLYSSKENAYAFTIMQIDYLLERIRELGFGVTAHRIRRRSKNVLNHGTYQLHDFVLLRS